MLIVINSEEEDNQCHNIQAAQNKEVSPALSILMNEYSSIFDMPTTLPPHTGSFNHRIPLIEVAPPLNKRPYKYPGVKKNIIKKLVQEILKQGVIQHSTSPYASLVVLVGKKYGSSRLL